MLAQRSQTIPLGVLSGALIAFGLFWYWAFLTTDLNDAHTKMPLAKASLFSLLFICLNPLACVVLGVAVFRSRHRACQRLSRLDWCGVVVAAGPLIFLCYGSVLFLTALADAFFEAIR